MTVHCQHRNLIKAAALMQVERVLLCKFGDNVKYALVVKCLKLVS